MKLISTLFLALSMLAAPAPAADNANDLFQQALVKERTDGNLPEAIKLYQRIVDKYAGNHKVAAEALLQLAGCQSKLGDAQARKSLERLVRDFADQKETVAEASRRLAAMGLSKPTAQPQTRLVWAGPKSYADSISPDGRYVSYTDWDTGNLAVHDLVNGSDRFVTTSGSWKRGENAYAEMSSISTDGSQIAYTWWEDKVGRDELWVASLSGDPKPRRVLDRGANSVHWSPDGRSIALCLADASEEGKSYLTQTRRIALLSAQDGSLRVLKTGPEVAGAGPFSPDGKYLLYGRKNPGPDPDRVYILSLDGKSDAPLLPDAIPAISPLWTPDASRIVFGKRMSGQPGGLWSVRVTNGKPAGEPEQLLADSERAVPIGFVRDGSLFYDSVTVQTDIYVAGLDPTTGTLTAEPRLVNERATGARGRLAWLPDSASLSFWTTRNGRAALVVHTLSTGEEREVVVHDLGAEKGYVGWFPDGSLMAQETLGPNRVFRQVDSRTMGTLSTWTVPNWANSGVAFTAFARDLMAAYFPRKDEAVQCNGAVCMYAMIARDFRTGRDRELFRLEASSIFGPSVSPDGRELAFIAGRPDRALMIAPTSGGAAREIYRGSEAFLATAWTQDGAHVMAFRSGELWSFPAGGGAPARSSMHRTGGIAGPAISPDGTHLAFILNGSKSGIWAMTAPFGK